MPIQLPQVLFWCLNKHHVTDKRSLWCTRTVFFPSGSSSHLFGIVAAWALTDTMALRTKTEQQKKRKFRKMCHISLRHFYVCLCIITKKISGQCGRWDDLGWPSLTDLITDEKNRWIYGRVVGMSGSVCGYITRTEPQSLSHSKDSHRSSIKKIKGQQTHTLLWTYIRATLTSFAAHQTSIIYPAYFWFPFHTFHWPHIPLWTSITSPLSSLHNRHSQL